MPATLHVIELARSLPMVPGRLATMARPRGGAQLAEELTALRAAGVDVVVSALTPGEAGELDLTGEADAVRAAGMEFVAHPIVDLGVPDPAETAALADTLAAAVAAGRFVVVHCWAGIGRSSLIAGSVLVRFGIPPAQAWRLIAAARGFRVPETAEQGQWLVAFAARGDTPRPMPNNRRDHE